MVVQGLQEIPYLGMVSCFAADVSEENPVGRGHDKGPAQLPGIALYPGLAVAAAPGSHQVAECAPRKGPSRTAAEPGGPKGGHFRIDPERGRENQFVPHVPGLGRQTVADHHQLGAPLLDLRVNVTQLRDLLAAEQSAEVADEDEENRLLLPGAPQDDRISIRVGKFDRCQALGSVLHRLTFLG